VEVWNVKGGEKREGSEWEKGSVKGGKMGKDKGTKRERLRVCKEG
jgi:hypothetical protein